MRVPDRAVIASLLRVRGVLAAERVEEGEFPRLLALEDEAAARSILGPGKLVNAGVREVVRRDRVFVALTSPEFDWGRQPSLVLKKGDQVVGEEVHDEERIRELRETPDVWFMHDSFVVYKDRMTFPKDLAARDCFFEIPPLPADWLATDEGGVRELQPVYANPSPPCDLHLKARHFPDRREEGLGTILLGLGAG
ncbi:MAG: hypothetical protein Kow0092_23340 [Deferrisomatales bacterium]